MAANTEKKGGGLGHRFKDSALERRRPSKRQTTVRSFSIVRSWKSQQSSSSSAAPKSHKKGKTVSASRVSSTPQPKSRRAGRPEGIPAANEVDTAPGYTSPVFPSQHSAHHSIVISRDSPNPIILTSSRALSIGLSVPSDELSTLAATEASPDCVVLSSPQAQVLPSTSSTANLYGSTSMTPAMADNRKTPKSGPGTYKGPGRPKRKRTEAVASDASDQELGAEYKENKFVRLFNADQGRSKSVREITDLDVILTSIEGIALDYRKEIEGGIGKQVIKEFFIQVRKILTDRIDSYKEHQMLKSDLRKAKSRVNKCRKELLSIQQQRSRVKAELEKSTPQQQKPSERQKVLEEISMFLTDLEALERESRDTVSLKKLSKKDYASPSNLPSLLSEGYSLVTASSQLGSINDSLQQWLEKTTSNS